jgi:hypothetical protein
MTTTTAAPPQGTAIATAEAVRGGASTAEQTVAAALDRIDARDGDIGAFQTVRRDAALAEARAVDERTDRTTLPLAGVPVARVGRARSSGRHPAARSRGGRRRAHARPGAVLVDRHRLHRDDLAQPLVT